MYEEAERFGVRFWPREWWRAGFRPFVETNRLGWREVERLASSLEARGRRVGALISRQY